MIRGTHAVLATDLLKGTFVWFKLRQLPPESNYNNLCYCYAAPLINFSILIFMNCEAWLTLSLADC